MRLKDVEMHNRLCEEIYRLGSTNAEAARKLNCDSTLVGEWLNNGYMPSAYYFKNFHYAGCDIIYILTGERRA